MIFWIWAAVALALLVLYFRRIYSKFTRAQVNHVPPVPILGNIWRVTLRREHFVDMTQRVYTRFPEDRFVGHYDFMKPAIVVKDLDLIKKVAVKDFDSFLDHREFISEKVDPLFGSNLFSLKGQKWKDMRSTLSPAFTSSKIRLMVPFMTEVGDQMIMSLKKKLKEHETGGIDVEMKDISTRYANDVIASCAFGLKVDSHGEENNDFYKMADGIDIEMKDLSTRYANDVIASCAFGLKVDSHGDENNDFYKMGKAASTFTFTQLLKILLGNNIPFVTNMFKIKLFADSTANFFRNLVEGTMKNREENNIIRPDMIHLLMEAKKGNLIHDTKGADEDAGFATVGESSVGKSKSTRVWSDNDLLAQAVLFFIAGFDTVATVMTFVLYELALNPECQDKLAEEIRETDQKNHGFDYNSIQHMKYLDMVVSETLRKWPPAIATDRVAARSYNLGKGNSKSSMDYIINKGETLFIPIWAIQHDPKYFENPDKFDPERFSDENKHKIDPITYLPFGVGPRNCIGSRFALCEVKVMVYQLIQHMEVLPCEKTCIPPKLTKETFNIRLEGGHWLKIKPRK